MRTNRHLDRNTRLNHERPSTSSAWSEPHSQADKPTGKLLTFCLQVLITATILSILFVSSSAVAIIVILHLCLLGVALHRRCRRRTNHHYLLDCDDDSLPRVSSFAHLRKKLPRFRFKAEQGSDEELCGICLEDFMSGDRCCKLPDCNHVFHVNCVAMWLVKTPICPVCRTTYDFRVEEKEVVSLQSD